MRKKNSTILIGTRQDIYHWNFRTDAIVFNKIPFEHCIGLSFFGDKVAISFYMDHCVQFNILRINSLECITTGKCDGLTDHIKYTGNHIIFTDSESLGVYDIESSTIKAYIDPTMPENIILKSLLCGNVMGKSWIPYPIFVLAAADGVIGLAELDFSYRKSPPKVDLNKKFEGEGSSKEILSSLANKWLNKIHNQ